MARKRQTPEGAVLRQALDYLALRRIPAFRVNNTGVYDPVRKVYRTFHGTPGVPDVVGWVPGTATFLGVECKAPGGRVSPAQQDFLGRLRADNGVAVVAYSLKDLEQALADAGL